jgi:8-oxo-dGTP pyrophosphatase MutT (NUDIX family)
MRITHTQQVDLHREACDKTGFWGASGSGALLLAKNTKRILFAHRGKRVQSPNTWGTWGGAIDLNEAPEKSVIREIKEESGYRGRIQLLPLITFKHESGFRYYNFLAIVESEFLPILDWENQDFEWVKFGQWPRPLHEGTKFLLSHSASTILDISNKLR